MEVSKEAEVLINSKLDLITQITKDIKDIVSLISVTVVVQSEIDQQQLRKIESIQRKLREISL